MVLNAVRVACGAVCARTYPQLDPCAFAGPGTARDAVRAWQVGGAQVKVNRKVSCLVTGSKAKPGVVVLVAAVIVDSPFIRALWHNEEPVHSRHMSSRPPRPTRVSCHAPQILGL